jgi:hypothetical protein
VSLILLGRRRPIVSPTCEPEFVNLAAQAAPTVGQIGRHGRNGGPAFDLVLRAAD